MAEVSPDYTANYRIDKMFPEGEMSILFAQGGSLKTYLALDIARGMLYEGHWLGRVAFPSTGVMFIDYESSKNVIRKRFQRLLVGRGMDGPPPETFHYFDARGIPISTQIESIRRDVKRLHIDFVIVDSAAAACGGKPEDADMALATFNALQSLGVTVLLIAHNTKADDERYPFGSIFWHNSARSTHFIKKVQIPGEDDIHLGVHNRKMNDDAQQPSFGVKIHFDGKNGPVTVDYESIQDQQRGSAAQSEAMLDTLARQDEPISVRALGDALYADAGVELSGDSIRTMLGRALKSGKVVRTGTDRLALWAVRED